MNNFKKLIKEALTPHYLRESVNEDLSQKLNNELGSIDGTFAEEDIKASDADFYDVKPGKYIKFYIEDVNNSTILKVKRIAKANGLKFAKDLEDMLLFTESVNEDFTHSSLAITDQSQISGLDDSELLDLLNKVSYEYTPELKDSARIISQEIEDRDLTNRIHYVDNERYEFRESINEADKYVDARGNFKLRNGLEVKIKPREI